MGLSRTSKAADPMTPATELARMAHRGRHDDCVLVASNPNTPTATLLELSGKYPREVAHNPAFALALLTDPDLTRRLPAAGAAALATLHGLPGYLYEALARDHLTHVGRLLAGNACCPPALLHEFCIGPHRMWRALAAQNPASPRETIEVLRRAGADASLKQADPDARVGERDLRAAAALGGWGQVLAAAHPSAPADLLEQLAETPVEAIQMALASNPGTPLHLLERLCKHDNLPLLASVLDNPLLPDATLRAVATRLLADPARQRQLFYNETFLMLASRHRLPGDLLAVLTQLDPAPPEFFAALASNPNLSASSQERIHQRHPGATSLLLARRPDAPPALLGKLAGSYTREVRQAARNNDALPDAWKKTLKRLKFSHSMEHFPPMHVVATADDLLLLTQSGPWFIDYLIRRPDLPLRVFEAVIPRADASQRKLLGKRPDLPPHLKKAV